MNMYPWQLEVLEKIEGIKKGEMMIMMASRKTGKSVFTAQAIKRLMDDLNNRPIEDLILSEARVHGARYHCVQPVGGSWPEMEAWCRKTFGEPGDMWESNDWCWPETARWLQNNRKFWFRNERDLTMFILKWR